uniref:Uncharacterized protein n=1 Tax=Caenorhabditis japonica TaxID=281687 RepID=A0A8R1EE21_CAEJA
MRIRCAIGKLASGKGKSDETEAVEEGRCHRKGRNGRKKRRNEGGNEIVIGITNWIRFRTEKQLSEAYDLAHRMYDDDF